MTPGNPTRLLGARKRPPWPRRLMAAVAAVLMASPGVAYPISLSHLLRLPLEELLRLEISGPASAPRLRSGAPMTSPMAAERRIT